MEENIKPQKTQKAQIAGLLMRDSTSELTAIGTLISLTGTALLITGLVFYAKAKGRHPAWCLMAFLSIIGLIVLALLKDKSQQPQTELKENIVRYQK